ncbi:MAG: signal peptidase I [Akkermansiaceae bacterium]|nr:signal peptidase I [Akkermansiaceae bacterium]
MQPTLNGIIGTPLKREEWPSFPKRMLDFVLKGRSYVYEVADQDRQLIVNRDGRGNSIPDIRDIQYMHFFSRSELRFSDAPPLRLPAPLNPCSSIGLSESLGNAIRNGGVLRKGTVICEGVIDTGDLVLVDKFSYHFRKPKRGEVFVFNTIDIEGTRKRVEKNRSHIADQEDATHYIKRLAAVPGDTLSVSPPHILIDGKIAREPGFEKVYQMPLHDGGGAKGYSFASPGSGNGPPVLVKPGDQMVLKKDDAAPGMREYAALGDNSGNSLDSRYWGSVKEFNVVGPALFSLWPITSGHWGFIR